MALDPSPGQDRVRVLYIALAALSGLGWVLGFAFGEDSSGGAAYDFRVFHWPASQLFANKPFWISLHYYSSATTPLQHILMSRLPWINDAFAYRLTGFMLGTAALGVFGVAVWRRFGAARHAGSIAALATGAVALSPGFRSAAFWGDTDALPLLFTALVCLLLHDRATGTWRAHISFPRVVAVAVIGAAAFYTRQLYVFVPIWSCWLLWSRTGRYRAPMILVFALTAVPALFLFWLWGGLTPPRFQTARNAAGLLYVGAIMAPFALPFVLAQRPAQWRWPTRGSAVAFAAGLLLFFVAYHGLPLTPIGGGLVTKTGLLLGRAGPAFVIAAAVLGWYAVMTVVCSSWDNAVLFGFAVAPLLLAGAFYQRYFDPLAFTIVLLLVSPPLSRRLVTERAVMAGYVFFCVLEAVGLIWFVLLGHTNPNA